LQDYLTPTLTALGLNLGVGLVMGLAVGYALKKIAKLFLLLGGLLLLILVVLAYKGVITVNYEIIEEYTRYVLDKLKLEVTGLVSYMNTSLPFAGGFMAGFLIGLKKG